MKVDVNIWALLAFYIAFFFGGLLVGLSHKSTYLKYFPPGEYKLIQQGSCMNDFKIYKYSEHIKPQAGDYYLRIRNDGTWELVPCA